MVRMNHLRNYPVICCSRQIGLLQSISLDKARKRVYALIVSGGMRGKRVVFAEQICGIAESFIIVSGAERYRRAYEKPCSPFVRDTTGLLVGCIVDYAIDEKTLTVLAAEIIAGYTPADRKKKLWVYAGWSTDGECAEIIVPASLSSELIFSREGTDDAYVHHERNSGWRIVWPYCRGRADDDASG